MTRYAHSFVGITPLDVEKRPRYLLRISSPSLKVKEYVSFLSHIQTMELTPQTDSVQVFVGTALFDVYNKKLVAVFLSRDGKIAYIEGTMTGKWNKKWVKISGEFAPWLYSFCETHFDPFVVKKDDTTYD
jgi:hypothetical protein